MATQFTTGQEAVDAIVEFLAAPKVGESPEASVKRIMYLVPAALDIAKQFGTSKEKCDALARQFLGRAKLRGRLVGSQDFHTACAFIRMGAYRDTIGRALDTAARWGQKRVVEELAALANCAPTSQEAFAVVWAQASDLSCRVGGREKYHHPFMTDEDVELVEWAKQYIGDSAKIRELEERFQRKNELFENYID